MTGWQAHALCHAVASDLWHPDTGDAEGFQRARAVCAACPVRLACAEHAIAHREPFGVWGGLSSRQRRVIAGVLAIFGVPVTHRSAVTVAEQRPGGADLTSPQTAAER